MTNEELCLLIQHGNDKKAYMEQLYIQNKNLIAHIAKKYIGYAEYEDLTQEGYFGLLKAAESFDDERGTQFVTHAYQHIRASIHRYIENNSNAVRIPACQRALILKMNKLIDDYCKRNSYRPSVADLAELMDISASKVRELVSDSLMLEIKSTNEPVFEDGESCCLEDCIKDMNDHYEEVLDKIQNNQLKTVLWAIVDSLEPLQRRVIHERYENNNDISGMSDLLDLPADQVRSAENKAMKELRNRKNIKKLRVFSDDRLYRLGISGSGYERFNQTWTSSTEKAVLFAEMMS